MPLKNSLRILIFFLFAGFLGCVKTPLPLNNLSEAQVKFAKVCQEEFKLTPTTNLTGNTLWVYVPFEKAIYEIGLDDADKKQMQKPPQKNSSLLYIDGKTEGRSFKLEYDITPATKSAKPPGFGTVYTEDFFKLQNNILTALSRSFFDVKDDVKLPEFVVLVVCDIQKGIEVKNTFNLEDLRQYVLGFLPEEEYLQRYLRETSGDKSFVADKAGSHLNLKPVEWPDFLLKQIINRVQFKYQASDFPPGEDAENEILKIAYQTFEIYKFKDYSSVELSDLLNKKEYTFDASQLATFAK